MDYNQLMQKLGEVLNAELLCAVEDFIEFIEETEAYAQGYEEGIRECG